MKNSPLTYDEAVEAYRRAFDGTKLLPDQPNKDLSDLSELSDATWQLRNIDGRLASVNCHGQVERIIDMKKIRMTEPDKPKKYYRVTLRADILLKVDLEARSKEEAEAKAFEWNCDFGGLCEKDRYYMGENDEYLDDVEMYWDILDIFNDIKDAVEIDAKEDDEVEKP